MKKILSTFALLAAFAFTAFNVQASEGGIPLDTTPDKANDMAALQNGAKLFVNHCLNCHSAISMRYNRLKDIGLSEAQIKANLLFSADKVGELMKTSLATQDAKNWFGVVPPDLSVIARAKSSERGAGPDWLYTYLRTFYVDESRNTGWNNMVSPNVAMPHVLWEYQGTQKAKYVKVADAHDKTKMVEKFDGFEMVKAGKMNKLEFDNSMADLVAYMSWMAEPAQTERKRLGVWVLLFLGLFATLAWALNASFWKEVK